jgi:hypothetical protein
VTSVRDHVVVAPTGFVPYFLYAWNGEEPHWLARRDIAKRFTAAEARRIANQLNDRFFRCINPFHVERVG